MFDRKCNTERRAYNSNVTSLHPQRGITLLGGMGSLLSLSYTTLIGLDKASLAGCTWSITQKTRQVFFSHSSRTLQDNSRLVSIAHLASTQRWGFDETTIWSGIKNWWPYLEHLHQRSARRSYHHRPTAAFSWGLFTHPVRPRLTRCFLCRAIGAPEQRLTS